MIIIAWGSYDDCAVLAIRYCRYKNLEDHVKYLKIMEFSSPQLKIASQLTTSVVMELGQSTYPRYLGYFSLGHMGQPDRTKPYRWPVL